MTTPDQPVSMQALERERERVVTFLTRQFANDNLSVDELEARLEMVYRAGSLAEVRALASDLPDLDAVRGAPALRPAPAPSQSVRARMVSLLSSRVRRGVWIPPQELHLVAVMSDTHLDLRAAQLSAGVTEICVKATFAAVRITVPPHVHVVTETTPVLASVTDRTGRGAPPPRGAPVLRITGWAVMSDVTVRTRDVND
jgi:DUF1707 SHOCT-like domain/Cell wall-active antibiotics response LiaF, C-terminal